MACQYPIIYPVPVPVPVDISIGNVTSLPAGTEPTVTSTQTSNGIVIDFGIPQGQTGPAGPTGGGVSSIGAAGVTSPNPNGGQITNNTLFLAPADQNNPGLVTSGNQPLGGDKTFYGRIYALSGIGFPYQGTGTSNVLSYYEQGSAVATYTGLTTQPSFTFTWCRVGSIVTVSFPPVNGVVAAAGNPRLTVGLPTNLTPVPSTATRLLYTNQDLTGNVTNIGTIEVTPGVVTLSGALLVGFTTGRSYNIGAWTGTWLHPS